MIKVPYTELAPDALRALVEEFITREGTDYGHQEVPLETKVRQVMSQLQSENAFVTFDPETETATVVSAESLSENSF